MSEFLGKIDNKTMNPVERRAYFSLTSQRARCNNPSHPFYKWYGAKGVKVEYGTREFIFWYVEQYKKNEWKCATVGRVDHSKNYCLENIEMVEKVENCKERIRRLGLPSKHLTRRF